MGCLSTNVLIHLITLPVEFDASFKRALPILKKYVPREFRREWSPVGLVGKLIVRKGQVVGDRWIKMKDINDQLEQYLVR